jgi:hypothetical protein
LKREGEDWVGEVRPVRLRRMIARHEPRLKATR